ncbi:MAG: preprotein translocase subunit SecY [Planctomycetota bacterium]|nr:MAG: preprotein translocase subunit SecY [Planctomycetota bacterium]REJ97162.1 MAG: preprotein translocase subunit SecY [Planctomycetota bacterium]REK27971.1 MAG: preprotein translocase subunit SecY [Planctomycetota bacterium]REK48711.1 MAG: preprotein translocase subunit SecY [Planctomycetota bacterium]
MWEKIVIIFTKIPELRRKILLTLLLLAIYRVGWQIPLPMIDSENMLRFFSGGALGGLLEHVAIFSASQLNQATIFGLGIMPYISASIIFQLLGSVWKPLEELQKEGESGRKKINEYTRYATVALCLLQSYFYLRYLISATAAAFAQGQTENMLIQSEIWTLMQSSYFHYFGWQMAGVLTMTTGTVFLMWLGEQIDEYGIGNGISLLIMAGILARMPDAGLRLLRQSSFELGGGGTQLGVEHLLVLAVMFVLVIFGVVYITQGQRRIPIQSAKHVRGRRVYGGTREYLPLKVNQAGVMPIIFASSLLMVPVLILGQLEAYGPFWRQLSAMFRQGQSYTYNLLYIGMIYFFCYFWTAITFNPKDMAENLKNFGTFIPGHRPGQRTADYLERVMLRITYVGAGFLALVAVIPTIISGSMNVDFYVASFYGGTGLLIAVSVAIDLVQKIDSHLVMRNYQGLVGRG